ncbi:hypothetical protein F2Q69_00029728 [Brassica cretica]|uniref:Uncharacterized protein n=1 Tax=Brassica cretica TaxID=69181 RepID=A0A8S9RY55_BRACR|nr:hypothetical protein F2Q69_00029728 [Brassica cretica]
MTAIDKGKSSRGQTGNARFGAKCSIPIPQSELDQSKVGLIRQDRHVGHAIWIVLLPSGYRIVWRVVIKPVAELLEKLGEQVPNYLIEPRVVTGFGVISNCPDRQLKEKRSAGMRGDISALYGSGETRERDILRESDSDRKDRESWPEGGSGSQLLAAGTVREGNISDLCSAWVLVNSSSPSYRGLDDADLPWWMAGSVEAGSAGSVHGLMVSDERRPEASSIHHGLSVGWSLRRFDLVVCWRGRKVAVKPGVFTGIWMRASTGLCGPRVEIIGTKDWKSGVLAKDLLGEQETTRRNRVGLLRHNSSDTMYLPRHNCTVTGTQGVHYCGFPIAMKAWMGTRESLPSHVCRMSVCLICHVCTDVFGNC